MNSWIFDELSRREFMKKTALTGAAAYLRRKQPLKSRKENYHATNRKA